MLVALEMEVPAGTPLFAKVEAVEQAHTPEQHSPRIEIREICRSVLALLPSPTNVEPPSPSGALSPGTDKGTTRLSVVGCRARRRQGERSASLSPQGGVISVSRLHLDQISA